MSTVWHQLIRRNEKTACGLPKHDVQGTHLCAGVTCPECRDFLERLVDKVFEPLGHTPQPDKEG